ncbi:MAG: EAL domain-containing protein [Verrucomicrobiales bacterium]|nr:EAL domain-containing protein [Verrucomicrobiales bacterium]
MSLQGSQLLERLTRAVRDRRLTAFYQPIVSGRDLGVTGFESLARWNDPDLGWVPPHDFIPLAEQNGLIGAIARHLADLALGALSRWRAAGWDVGVSLNVSRGQVLEKDFCSTLTEIAAEHGVAPGWITLEVTEREAFLESPGVCEVMREAVSRGFRWSLDDFGAGYASYHCLVDLPLSELKVDMRLCQRVRDSRVKRMLQSILELAEALEIESVAEGVEDVELTALLREVGFLRLQGYQIARPMPIEATLGFLEQASGVDLARGA